MRKSNPFHGIHAATVAPMRPDYSLDEGKRLSPRTLRPSRVCRASGVC